jgi:hypothetical protein
MSGRKRRMMVITRKGTAEGKEEEEEKKEDDNSDFSGSVRSYRCRPAYRLCSHGAVRRGGASRTLTVFAGQIPVQILMGQDAKDKAQKKKTPSGSC